MKKTLAQCARAAMRPFSQAPADRLTRRSFLRSTGAILALPSLDAFQPRNALASAAVQPRRMVCICTTLGINAESIFPKQTGRDYALTPYLEPLNDLREHFTIFSGVAHPDVDGGHSSEATFLSAAPHPKSPGFKNSISLDQYLLEQQPAETRYANLNLTTSNLQESLSVSRTGVMLPADDRPSVVFRRLFVNGTPAEVAEQTHRLSEGRSIMDLMSDEARRLQRRVSARDAERLDEYFTSVREVEQRLHKLQQWALRPKPSVLADPPADIPGVADVVGQTRLMFDLMHLALENDSTRIITFRIQGQQSVPPLPGVKEGWHNLSHHGKDPEKLKQLRLIELEQMKLLSGFLLKLNSVREGGSALLDSTSVLYGSNLGNASSHDTTNLPIILAGGGFRHGQYLAYDSKNNQPLCNLFVAMLRQHGLDVNAFASSQSPSLPQFS